MSSDLYYIVIEADNNPKLYRSANGGFITDVEYARATTHGIALLHLRNIHSIGKLDPKRHSHYQKAKLEKVVPEPITI
jgi:hypothetical protein